MPNFCINFLNKAEKSLPILYDFAVAPLTGAWIKTREVKSSLEEIASHPSRVRGLKLQKQVLASGDVASHPSRVRGLKPHNFQKLSVFSRRTPHGCVD